MLESIDLLVVGFCLLGALPFLSVCFFKLQDKVDKIEAEEIEKQLKIFEENRLIQLELNNNEITTLGIVLSKAKDNIRTLINPNITELEKLKYESTLKDINNIMIEIANCLSLKNYIICAKYKLEILLKIFEIIEYNNKTMENVFPENIEHLKNKIKLKFEENSNKKGE